MSNTIFQHHDSPYKEEKVVGYFPVQYGEVEELWMEQNSESIFVIKSIPFFLKDINYEDVVSCTVYENTLIFDKVITKSDWFTFRIHLLGTLDEKQRNIAQILSDIESFGSKWERFSDDFYSMSVETASKGSGLEDYLVKLESMKVIEYDTLDSLKR